MKKTDITKIRQLLKKVKNLTSNVSGKILNPDIFCLVSQALALLPCETCGGTKQIRKLLGHIGGMPLRDYVGPKIPCLDCQPSEKPLDFQEILDCWSVHPIDDEDCESCPQMHECRDFRKGT